MTHIVTYAVPAELWKDKPRAPGPLDVIQDLAQEVVAIDRRLKKRVNEDVERDRYQETCELLETAVCKAASDSAGADYFSKLDNDGDYFEMLATGWLARLAADDEGEGDSADAWLGASVIPPENVPAHLDALTGANSTANLEKRIAFLREVVNQAAGIVECQMSHNEEASAYLMLGGHLGRRVASRVDLDQQGRVDVADVFRRRVEQAMTSGEAVNMNNQNHVAITQVLAEFLLADENHSPGQIRVAYGDGSEAPPFPLRCLIPANAESKEIVVPFSLMSMRHLLLDQSVVRNWLRNREIDQDSTLARGDLYCYQHAAAEFRSLRATVRKGERMRVELYHTGYEPAVVGVYRAAVEAIRDGGDWLRIVPHYYVDSGFMTGPSWPPFA